MVPPRGRGPSLKNCFLLQLSFYKIADVVGLATTTAGSQATAAVVESFNRLKVLRKLIETLLTISAFYVTCPIFERENSLCMDFGVFVRDPRSNGGGVVGGSGKKS